MRPAIIEQIEAVLDPIFTPRYGDYPAPYYQIVIGEDNTTVDVEFMLEGAFIKRARHRDTIDGWPKNLTFLAKQATEFLK